MVEFGLKLEDNKVSEWSDKYISYEKLKSILNKGKNAIKKRDELMKRKPDWAKQIKIAYEDDGRYAFQRNNNSCSNISDLVNENNVDDSTAAAAVVKKTQQQQQQQPADETKPLLLRRILSENQLSSSLSDLGNYQEQQEEEEKDETAAVPVASSQQQQQQQGSKSQGATPYSSFDSTQQQTTRNLDRKESSGALSDFSESATNIFKGVTDYFSSSKNYEMRLRDSLKEIDTIHMKFDKALQEELNKVNEFYDDKMSELTNQLDYLVESVTSSELFKVTRRRKTTTHNKSNNNHNNNNNNNMNNIGDDVIEKEGEEGNGSNNKSHPRRKSSLAQMVINRFGSGGGGFSHRMSPMAGHKHHGTTTVSDYELLNEDDYDDTEVRDFTMSSSLSDDDIKLSTATTPNINFHHREESIQEKEKHLEHKKRESDSIKRAIIDQYRTVKLLHNFAILNYTGFVKIIKKHDKTFASEKSKKGMFKDISSDPTIVCREGIDASTLSDRMELLFAKWFCNGNIREAHAQMLPKRGDGLQMDWSQMRLGYRLGMCSILTLWVCWDCIWGLVRDGYTTIGGRTAFPVFRGCGGLLLLHWCWGVSVYVWSRYRINYIYLFDFNPNVVDSPISIFNDVVDETLIYSTLMLLYYKSGAHDIPDIVVPGVYPAILVLFTMKSLMFPWKTRSSMWKGIYEVITSPYHSPTFFTVYIGDVLTSLVKVFQDIAWTFCFMLSGDFLESEKDPDFMHSSNNNSSHKHKVKIVKHLWQGTFWYKNVLIPLLCLLPLWFRFNQCLRKYMDTKKRWPNLANALKYAISQTVTLFGAFHPLYLTVQNGGEFASNKHLVGNFNLFQIFWMTLFVVSSLYSFAWDVYMDWGLGQFKYNFLGPSLMFPSRSYYYGVIAADLVLRSMWVLSLIPPNTGAKFEIPQYLTAVTMSLEILRRTIWAFFRLENEHRSNTGQFRRVNFVPLHFNTGHMHKYKNEREHVGWRVLAEVGVVSLLVIGVSAFSVIAAQRASSRYKGHPNDRMLLSTYDDGNNDPFANINNDL